MDKKILIPLIVVILALLGGVAYLSMNLKEQKQVNADMQELAALDIYYQAALKQAEKAIALGEVPIGAVIVCGGKIIARGYNRRNTDRTTLAHAEITCIRKACKKMGDWRLEGRTLYVTLEPCPMCAGAILNARIPRVVFGAREPVTGSCGSVIDLFSENYGHRPAVFAEVCADESRALLQSVFRQRRDACE